MIQTLRDAEIEIRRLQDRFKELGTQISKLSVSQSAKQVVEKVTTVVESSTDTFKSIFIRRVPSGIHQPQVEIDTYSTTKARIGRVVAGDRLDITNNLYHDGAVWHTDDPTKVGCVLLLVGDELHFYTAPAAATPTLSRTFKTVFSTGEFTYKIRRDTLANIPVGLTANDVDFMFFATDYQHLYRWNGTGWEFGPGDPGSGWIAGNGGIQGGLWALCDGSNVTIALSNGSTTTVTTQDLTGDVHIQGASSGSAVRVATRVKWDAAAKTDDESSHYHNVNPPNTTSTASLLTTTVTSSGATTVSSSNHTHDVDIAPFDSAGGSAHSHTLTDAVAKSKLPDETDLSGLPKRIAVAWYIRR